jgi:hypothetical protein
MIQLRAIRQDELPNLVKLFGATTTHS